MFDIYVYDETSNTAKMEKFVNLGSIKNIEGSKLKDIRSMLISQNALTFRQWVASVGSSNILTNR